MFAHGKGKEFLRTHPVRWVRRLYIAARTFVKIGAEQRAASFAYYALFSFFPLLTILISVGSVFFEPSDFLGVLQQYLPLDKEGQQFIWKMMMDFHESRGSASLISIGVLMWTSLRFFQSLVRAVNRAWHTIELPWWQVRIKNFYMMGVMGSALLLGILAPAIMQVMESVILSYLPMETAWVGRSLFNVMRFGIPGILLFYAFVMLYMLAPRKRVPFSYVWVQAILVTILLQATQTFFIKYLPHLINYNAIYGSVGALMSLLMWIYVSGLIVIAGACLCAAFSPQAGEESIANMGKGPILY